MRVQPCLQVEACGARDAKVLTFPNARSSPSEGKLDNGQPLPVAQAVAVYGHEQ